MLRSKIEALYIKNEKPERICQGDVLRDIFVINAVGAEEEATLQKTCLTYAVVMTQDCDLLHDYKARAGQLAIKNNDKFLPSILVCPAYQADAFIMGTHIQGWQMQEVRSSDDKKKLRNNDEKNRLHYVDGDTAFGVPSLVVDFKHFYTIQRESLYAQWETCYLVTINELFRERLSQRFANYLSRFGLPSIGKDDE